MSRWRGAGCQRDPPLDEVIRHARWVMGGFKQDIDRVPMRPNQGFEPLVSIVLLVSCTFSP
jgi:hypothetical protein